MEDFIFPTPRRNSSDVTARANIPWLMLLSKLIHPPKKRLIRRSQKKWTAAKIGLKDRKTKIAAAKYQSDLEVEHPEDSFSKRARFRSRKPGKKEMVKRKRATIFARKKGTPWKLRVAVYRHSEARKEQYEIISAWLINIGVIRATCGWDVEHDQGSIYASQVNYIDRSLERLNIEQANHYEAKTKLAEENKPKLRQHIGKLGWVSDQSRPDASYEELAFSMTASAPTDKVWEIGDKVVRELKETDVTIKDSKWGGDKRYITVFTDARVGKLPEGISSATGIMIFLSNGCKPHQKRDGRYMKEKVINDVACTDSVEFNDKKDKNTKNDIPFYFTITYDE